MGIYSIEKIKEFITPIAKSHDLKKVCLFGSYARGEATEKSDIDLLVYGFTDKGYFEFCDMKDEFENNIGIPVDVEIAEDINLKLKMPNNRLIKKFAKQIKKDMVTVYERT